MNMERRRRSEGMMGMGQTYDKTLKQEAAQLVQNILVQSRCNGRVGTRTGHNPKQRGTYELLW